MSSLPTMMPASEIAAHHEPTPCDLCHTAPATLLVRCDVKRYASFRCDAHAATAMADLQADGSFVNAFPLRKPYSVEQADLVNDQLEDFPIHRPRMVTSGKATECGACQCQCLNAKPCPISDASSDHDAALFCAGCLKDCPKCGESVCYDHFDEKAKTCKACENTRKVESGEARDDYRRYGRES